MSAGWTEGGPPRGALERRPCKSCGAPVVWVTTAEGRRMPLDPDPVPNGNVYRTGQATVAYVTEAMALEPPAHRYVSHFATCPDRAKWRKER